MSDQLERLFKAWGEALARSTPGLDPRVRQRVQAAQASRRSPTAFRPAHGWALVGFAVAVTALLLLVLPKAAAPSFQVAGQNGAVGAWLKAEATRPLLLSFSEGTRVSLAEGSRARVNAVTRGGAHIELARGAVDADVAHLSGANWSFGAGPFEVAVTGTQLHVSWTPETGQFELSVTSGSVLVKGPFIQGLQAVQAGQLCHVDVPHRLMELGPIAAERAARSEGPPAAPSPPAPTGASAPTSASASQAAPTASTHTGSSAALQPVSADALLEAARAARLAGRPNEERAALLACRKHAAGQPAAAQAAYLLGRATAGAAAAAWFETYLREQPQGLLAREAAGRLIESYRASGNTSAAQTAASRYLARYPNGPHASLARQALARHGESQD